MDVHSGWKNACRTIFGEEIGELEEFQPYLLEHHYPCAIKKSAIGGNDVALSGSRYCGGAKIISQGEVEFEKKYAPFSINDIKDIDSVCEALQDRFQYCGNKVFGGSKFVSGSDNCDDSFYVLGSHSIVSSKYVGYSSFVRDGSSFIYGAVGLTHSDHIIRGSGALDSRNFETFTSYKCSDMFFAYRCSGCTQCMFSFNLHAKRHAIGNFELEKSKYLQLRKKLAEEVASKLRKDKRFHSIYDFAAPTQQEIAEIAMPRFAKKKADSARLDEAFARTCELVLGRKIGSFKDFSRFLELHVPKTENMQSAFGNECNYSDYFLGKNIPRERLVSANEAEILEKRQAGISPGDSTAEIILKVGAIAFYPTEAVEGESKNNSETQIEYNSHDCHKVAVGTFSQRSAYCAHIHRCDAIFGSGMLMVDSSFCIRCHNCVKVTCSMDLDSCTSCARCLFCHNCENVHDSMFCFNAKNLKYAIGNVEVGREKYMEVRKTLLENICSQLGEKGTIAQDICSIGCRKGN